MGEFGATDGDAPAVRELDPIGDAQEPPRRRRARKRPPPLLILAAGIAVAAPAFVWRSPAAQPPAPEAFGTAPAWSTVSIPLEKGEIHDVVGSIAVGERGGRASAWTMASGSPWTEASLGVPPGPSRLTAATSNRDGFLALGLVGDRVGRWTSPTGTAWEFHGEVPSLESIDTVTDVAASQGILLLVGTADNRTHLFTSADGLSWMELEPAVEPTRVRVAEIVSFRSGFLLAGSSCDRRVCRPALWTLTEGADWSPARGLPGFENGELLDEWGTITSLAACGDGVIAAGWTRFGYLALPQIWRSDDGEQWQRLPPTGALGTPQMTVGLRDVTTAGRWREAAITVDGFELDLMEDSTFPTPFGDLDIIRIDPGSATLEAGGTPILLFPGGETTVQSGRQILDLAASGPRVVAVGFESDLSGAVVHATVWTSDNGGRTWASSVLPDSSGMAGRFAQPMENGRWLVFPAGHTDHGWFDGAIS